jgi:flagellar basal body-associated protein FliL
MKRYFVHLNEQQHGPFTLEELKGKNINRETMVWYTGLPHWVPANRVEELQELLAHIPPPIYCANPGRGKMFSFHRMGATTSGIPGRIPNPGGRRTRALTILLVGLLVFAGIGGFWYTSQHGAQDAMQLQSSASGKLLTEQEKREAKLRADKERQLAAEREEQRQKRVWVLKRKYEKAVISLRAENEKLEEIKEFKFLRTLEEKEEEVRRELEVIRGWENKLFKLQNEISLLGATVNL